MTPDELDAAISEIIVPHVKPRSKQNSYRRKHRENERLWRICTIGKSCKLGIYKPIFNDGKAHEDLENLRLGSFYRGLSGIFRSGRVNRLKEYSYNKKFVRRWANRRVRHYAGDVGNHSFYRKIFDYEWECW